jgi:Fe-S cluster biogenesis protein NfuA
MGSRSGRDGTRDEPGRVPTGQLSARADQALDGKVRQLVEAHGGGVEVAVDDAGDARVTFRGRCAACPSAPVTMGSLVTPALLRIEGVRSVSRSGGVSRFAEARIARMFGLNEPTTDRSSTEDERRSGRPIRDGARVGRSRGQESR